MSVNILLADDHLMVREGLKQVLELDHDIDVISEASDGYECLNLINKTHPDVVLLDINMPNLDGLQVLSIMKQQKMKSKVIMLTIHTNALFKNNTLAGSTKIADNGNALCATIQFTPFVNTVVTVSITGPNTNIAKQQRIAPIIPSEKLFTIISNPDGIFPSTAWSNFLMQTPATGPKIMAAKNIGVPSTATIAPIVTRAPITPPRSPPNILPPVCPIKIGSK